MGNCLQTPTSDDISLLRGSDGNPDNNDPSDLDSPPPYNQEQESLAPTSHGGPPSPLRPSNATSHGNTPAPLLPHPNHHSTSTRSSGHHHHHHHHHRDSHQRDPTSYLGGSRSHGGGHVPIYHPSPGVSRPAHMLTEEEQIKIAQRIGLIQHLPMGHYDESKKNQECIICMTDFLPGDPVRYLPCMHTYHMQCIDDWLMRSFTCPSCMEPVDAALLCSYEAT